MKLTRKLKTDVVVRLVFVPLLKARRHSEFAELERYPVESRLRGVQNKMHPDVHKLDQMKMGVVVVFFI